jgi:hypothetical protein
MGDCAFVDNCDSGDSTDIAYIFWWTTVFADSFDICGHNGIRISIQEVSESRENHEIEQDESMGRFSSPGYSRQGSCEHLYGAKTPRMGCREIRASQ